MVEPFWQDYNESMLETEQNVSSSLKVSKRCDIHIHVVGDAADGCYISESLLRKTWFRLMTCRIGIKSPSEYVSRLVQYLKESPIDVGVILAIDAIYDEKGDLKSSTSFYIPNSFIFKISSQYPELLPGVSIHPNRRDALEDIDRCAESGAVLVKWIPNAQGIDPSNKKYTSFYRKLANYKLPLLSHTGYEFTLPVLDHGLGNPDKLRLPLEEGVTVIAAHSGISYSGFSTKNMKTWLTMIKQYPNLYGDIAASSIGIVSYYLVRLLKDEEVCKRLVNGSDFPVPVLKSLSDIFVKSNPFTRDYDIKSRSGVPQSVFHRGFMLLRHPKPNECLIT
jgi:predicted TIM-barrel fold metal-dependent hydrolase